MVILLWCCVCGFICVVSCPMENSYRRSTYVPISIIILVCYHDPCACFKSDVHVSLLYSTIREFRGGGGGGGRIKFQPLPPIHLSMKPCYVYVYIVCMYSKYAHEHACIQLVMQQRSESVQLTGCTWVLCTCMWAVFTETQLTLCIPLVGIV